MNILPNVSSKINNNNNNNNNDANTKQLAIEHIFSWYYGTNIGIKSSAQLLEIAYIGASHNGRMYYDPYQDNTLDNILIQSQLNKIINAQSPMVQRIIYANYAFNPKNYWEHTDHLSYQPLVSLCYVFKNEHTIDLTNTILAISNDLTKLIQICNRIKDKTATIEDRTIIRNRANKALHMFNNTINTLYPLVKDIRIGV